MKIVKTTLEDDPFDLINFNILKKDKREIEDAESDEDEREDRQYGYNQVKKKYR